ncbi:unnamed protein product, partial [Brassica oleracea var. botrytis]
PGHHYISNDRRGFSAKEASKQDNKETSFAMSSSP